jgi:hypothetical protein
MPSTVGSFPTPWQSYVSEAEQLAALLPNCRRMVSELTAVVLLARLHADGFQVSLGEAEGCLDRMRIAVKTGVYPEEMLQAVRNA